MKITTYKDYLQEVYDEFPLVNKESIRYIVRYGLGSMAWFKNQGLDLYLQAPYNDIYYYIGSNYSEAPTVKAAVRKKFRKKARILYSLKKTPYSGYFYFACNELTHLNLLKGEHEGEIRVWRTLMEANQFTQNIYHYRVAIPVEDSKTWTKVLSTEALKLAECYEIKTKTNEKRDD